MSTAFTDSDLQSLASSDSESTNRGSPKSEFGLALGAGDTEVRSGPSFGARTADEEMLIGSCVSTGAALGRRGAEG